MAEVTLTTFLEWRVNNSNMLNARRQLTEGFPNIYHSIDWVKLDLFSHVGQQSKEKGHLRYLGRSVFSVGVTR